MGVFFTLGTQHFKIKFLWQEKVVQYFFMFCRDPNVANRNFDYVATAKYVEKFILWIGN